MPGLFLWSKILYTSFMSLRSVPIIIEGRVVRGDGYGKALGFPTANLDRKQFVRLPHKPRLGIYAGIATLSDRVIPAAIVIGPVDARGLPKLEAHLLNFSADLYDEFVSLELVKYLRPFKPYINQRDLISQIKKDIHAVRKVINHLK